jgi:nucleotide-binding universal stress UspA family protein
VAEKLVRRLPCPVLTVCHEEGRTWETPGLITRILCATDFSESSLHALEFTLAMAASTQAEVTLLHAVEFVPDLGDAVYRVALPEVQPLRLELQREAAKQLDETLARVRGEDRSVHVTPRVVVGRAYKEILWAATEERADLIVIGAQGHGPIEHMISGSNAQHVIRRATCPVLTVRPLQARAPVDEARSRLVVAVPARTNV